MLLALSITSCRNHDYIAEMESLSNNDNDAYDPSQVDLASFPDWTEATHSNSDSVDLEESIKDIFDDSRVMRLDITINSTNWAAMLDDLSSNITSSGGMGGGMDSDLDFTPIWAPCTVSYNGIDWYKVGLRFKGNSSLKTTYQSGNSKLSMKFDFDQYEDIYPALKNQRFYGFKQLNLNNNYNDESLMREKVGADLFRGFGLAAAHAAFCEVWIDYGSGSQYFGVYTLLEEVDDSVIKTQFDISTGNLYKPEDDAASFKSGTYNTGEFNLKTNTSSPNYSDVESLYNALHNSPYTKFTNDWCTHLESVFDVQTFLKWLAANAVIQNWDTYGRMTHNYYLYNDEGELTWIPWDNNEAFQSSSSQYSPIAINGMTSVSSSWPLINFLFDVSDYEAAYKTYVKEFVADVFNSSIMEPVYSSYQTLLYDFASAEVTGRTFFDSTNKGSEFTSAVSTLKTHVSSRESSVTSSGTINTYLNN